MPGRSGQTCRRPAQDPQTGYAVPSPARPRLTRRRHYRRYPRRTVCPTTAAPPDLHRRKPLPAGHVDGNPKFAGLEVAPPPGLEPVTLRSTVGCVTPTGLSVAQRLTCWSALLSDAPATERSSWTIHGQTVHSGQSDARLRILSASPSHTHDERVDSRTPLFAHGETQRAAIEPGGSDGSADVSH